MYKKYKECLRSHKGVTLVLTALMLFALIMIAGMAIDLTFMYFVKNQTQVAADAGALGGAALLEESGGLVQENARDKAVQFCSLNKAGGQPMTIANDPNSNTLSDTNDITVGYFNYITRDYTPNILPVNAIEVRTRRTENSPVGPVSIFLGKVGGWNMMSAASKAIAGRPVNSGAPLVLCIDVCSPSLSLPHTFHFDEAKSPTPADTIGWTELSTTTKATEIGLNSTVSQMIRGEIPMPGVCCEKIFTNNGVGAALTQVLPDKFAVEAAKTGGYWDILVPIVGQKLPDCLSQTEPKGCPPGDQPDEPYLVSQYARIRITTVNGPPDPGITISNIDCRSCPADAFMGDTPCLLK